MSENKITFTVVCDEIGKKYKISFKESIYHMITIKHVREHLKKAQSKSYSFELYYNGELLLDPMFCSQQNITNNSVVLMCLIKTPQLINGQLTQRYQAASPKFEQYSGINRGSMLMGSQLQSFNKNSVPMHAATALRTMQQMNHIEDQSDYQEINESNGINFDGQSHQMNNNAIYMNQNQNFSNQNQQTGFTSQYQIPRQNYNYSEEQFPIFSNIEANNVQQQESPKISQINVHRSMNNNDVRISTNHKFTLSKQQKIIEQNSVNSDEDDNFQQINVLSAKINQHQPQQGKNAYSDPPQMLLSRRPANNIFASSAHYEQSEDDITETQRDIQKQVLMPDGINNQNTDQINHGNQFYTSVAPQATHFRQENGQSPSQYEENEKIKKLESQVEYLQKQLQENEQNVSMLVKKQVEEVLKSQFPKHPEQFSVVNELMAQKERLISLQQQIANNSNVQTNKNIHNNPAHNSNPFSTAINADISDINTPILPSFNVKPEQTPLELRPAGNQLNYGSIQQNTKMQMQNINGEQNIVQQKQGQIDLDQYQESAVANKDLVNQQVHNNQFAQISNQQYEQEQKRVELEEEIENLEKVLALLQNEREILETDKANQQQLNANQAQQLEQLSKSRDQGAYMVAKAELLRRDIAKLQQRIAQSATTRRNLHNQVEDLKGNIRVFVRVRPQSIEEQPANPRFQNALRIIDSQTVRLSTIPQQINDQSIYPSVDPSIGAGGQAYKFYRVYGENTQQQQVFNDVKPVLRSALDGYNVFIGGYGSTGSGKTYTILGDEGNDGLEGQDAQYPTFNNDSVGYERLGILPRAVVELFYRLQLTTKNPHIEISMLELYCDTIIDLLQDEGFEQQAQNGQNQPQWVSGTSTINQSQFCVSKKDFGLKTKLEVKNDGSGCPYVRGLKRITAESADDAVSALGKGLSRRHVAATAMNGRSSRSHTLVYIYLPCGSTVLFADLAGSERLERTGSESQRQREAQAINQSLSALGDVMAALSGRRAHVPYRNSRLTQLLQPGFGGTSKALLFICLAPLDSCIQEAFCSLQFGARAKAVQNVSIKGLLG